MKRHVKLTAKNCLYTLLPQLKVRAPAALCMGHMTRALLGVSVISVLALTGCENHSKRHFTTGSINQNYKTRHPIIIDEQEQTLDIPVARASSRLAQVQASTIEGFAAQFHKTATNTITIMRPSGSSNQRAATKIAQDISRLLVKAGIPKHRQNMMYYSAASHGALAPVRLSYIAVKADVTGCGKWPADLNGLNAENRNYHNFGCATQNNLAAQIANPADLLGPRGSSEIDAKRRSNVIEDYRSGNITLNEPASDQFSTN